MMVARYAYYLFLRAESHLIDIYSLVMRSLADRQPFLLRQCADKNLNHWFYFMKNWNVIVANYDKVNYMLIDDILFYIQMASSAAWSSRTVN